MEGNERNELKRIENRPNWQNSMKQVENWQTSRPFLTEAQRRGAKDQLLGNQNRFSFFGSIDFGKLGRLCSDLFGYLRTSKTHL